MNKLIECLTMSQTLGEAEDTDMNKAYLYSQCILTNNLQTKEVV